MESYAIELRTMTSLSSYRELIVWQKSMDLTVRIYALTRCFPAAERYGITSQMRRSASSIPANIAEGQARRSTGEFVQSLGVARGSLAELETFLTLSTKLEMTTPEQCRCLLNDCAEISKMLNALIKSLSTNHSPLTTLHYPLISTNHSPSSIISATCSKISSTRRSRTGTLLTTRLRSPKGR